MAKTTEMRPRLLLFAALVFLFAKSCSAAFQSSFANVTAGPPLRLAWDAIEAKYYPLAISAKLINRTVDNRANGVQLNLTTRITEGSSWTWDTVPYPLPYISTGIYHLEIRPSNWSLADWQGAINTPVLAKSSFFTIGEDESGQSKPGQIIKGDDNGTSGPNKTLALGIGVSIGTTSVIAICIIAHVLRKRRKRVLQEKRRREMYIT